MARKKIIEAIPKIPVVATIEIKYPKPELKRAFQKTVLLNAICLNLSQSYTKVLGPVPKTALFFNDFFAMSSVADQDGLTSVKDISKALLILLVIPLASTKKTTAISANKETRRKLFILKSLAWPAKYFLYRDVMNINKEKIPKTTQLLKKLAATIAKKDMSKIA